MNNFLNQLNLSAQERRIVVGIFLVVIVVLNLLFVWPHFGEWGRLNKELDNMRKNIGDQNRVIGLDLDPTNGWKKKVALLARQQGSSVGDSGAVDPQVQFQRTIQEQERKTGVLVDNMNPGSVKTNAFFEEHSTTITASSQEPQLVNFLFNMGNDPAMIRVAKLDLQPADANRYRLKESITLTANYAKKAASTVAAPAPTKPAFGAKPTTPPKTPAKKAGGGPPIPSPNARRTPIGAPAPGGPRPPQDSKHNQFNKPQNGNRPVPAGRNPNNAN